MAIANLQSLFLETLKDICYVEKKLVKTLPKMAKKVASPELREAINSHLAETESHVQRVEEIFSELDRKPVARNCEALDGLIQEEEDVMEEIDDEMTLDAAIISSAQTVEHYEIARYGTLACWAAEIGNSAVADLLQKTLDEEKAAAIALSGIAEGSINQQAAA